MTWEKKMKLFEGAHKLLYLGLLLMMIAGVLLFLGIEFGFVFMGIFGLLSLYWVGVLFYVLESKTDEVTVEEKPRDPVHVSGRERVSWRWYSEPRNSGKLKG